MKFAWLIDGLHKPSMHQSFLQKNFSIFWNKMFIFPKKDSAKRPN
jgi:hypothetical protein